MPKKEDIEITNQPEVEENTSGKLGMLSWLCHHAGQIAKGSVALLGLAALGGVGYLARGVLFGGRKAESSDNAVPEIKASDAQGLAIKNLNHALAKYESKPSFSFGNENKIAADLADSAFSRNPGEDGTLLLNHITTRKTFTGRKLLSYEENTWIRIFGGSGDDYAQSIQQTVDGGYIVVGYTSNVGNSNHDAFVLKLDSSGKRIWAKKFGGANDDQAVAVRQIAYNGYIIVGYTNSIGAGNYDILIFKLDSLGNKVWAKAFGDVSIDWLYSNSLQQTADGGYIVTGVVQYGGGGSEKILVFKLNSSGNKIWAKIFGGICADYGLAVQQTSDGGYILAGHTKSMGSSNSNWDALVVKLNNVGTITWIKRFGNGLGDQWLHSIQQTVDGGYIATGNTAGDDANHVVLILKLDNAGNKVWAKAFGDGVGYAWTFSSSQQVADGGYIITGHANNIGAGGYDWLILKLDSSGNKVWAKTFGGSGTDYVYSIQQTADGGYIVAGSTNSIGAGNADVLIIKLDVNGNAPNYCWGQDVTWQTVDTYLDTGTFSWTSTDASLVLASADSLVLADWNPTAKLLCPQVAPVVSSPTADQMGLVNQVFNFTLLADIFSDENGDILTYNATLSDGRLLPSWLSFNAASRVFSGIPSNTAVLNIKVTVDDGHAGVVSDTFALTVNAKAPSFVKVFGGAGDDEARSVELTADGGYFVTGYTNSAGAGAYDAFLFKLDSLGNKVLAKTFGGSSDDQTYFIQQTSNDGYVLAGATRSTGAGDWDALIVKFDSAANKIWAKTLGGIGSDSAFFIQQVVDGGYIVTGQTFSIGAGGRDGLIFKLDSSGNRIWTKIFGGVWDDYAYPVQQTTDGGYIIAGATCNTGSSDLDVFVLKLNNSGNKIWVKTIVGSSGTHDWPVFILQSADGGYIVIGDTYGIGAGGSDVFILKLDSFGNKIWGKTFGGISGDGVNCAQQTADGGYIVVGVTQSIGAGGSDILVLKLDSFGNKVWARTFGGSNDERSYASIQQTLDGGYIIAGATQSAGTGNNDILIIKLDANGNVKNGCWGQDVPWQTVDAPGLTVGTVAWNIQDASTLTFASADSLVLADWNPTVTTVCLQTFPIVVNPIASQTSSVGTAFSLVLDPIQIFSDADGDEISITNVTLSDGTPLPAWLKFREMPINLVLKSTYDTPGIALGVTVKDNYAYVADYVSGLQIVDVSDPVHPVFVGTYNTAGLAHGVRIQSHYAYVADWDAGLQIIDISNPIHPVLKGTYDTPGHARELAVKGNYVYVADEISLGLQIVDVSDPSHPTLKSTCYTPGYAQEVTVRDNYAYVADYESGLQIIDITDPAHPVLKSNCDTSGYAYGVVVKDNYVYIADQISGLQIIDITDPAHPTLKDTYNTPGLAFGLIVKDKCAFIADWDAGLQIIDVSDPVHPILKGSYDTPGYAHGITVRGNYAYIADYESGLQIIEGDWAKKNLTGTPINSDSGIVSIKITADDGNGGIVSDIFDLIVKSSLIVTHSNQTAAYIEDTTFDFENIVIETLSATVDVTLTMSDVNAGTLTTGTLSGVTSIFASGVWHASGNVTAVNQLLAGLQFIPAPNSHRDFTISVQVNDRINYPYNDTIAVTGVAINDAPVLSSVGGSFVYVENTLATVVDGTISVSDTDNPNIANATVWISSGFVNGEDALEFTNQNGITGSYNAATGALTLSGNATQANYQIALRSIKYKNTSENPSLTGRVISFKVNDGALDSNTVIQGITLQRVNDAPVVNVALQTQAFCCAIGVGQAYNFTFAANTFTDVDGDTLTYTATKVDGTALPSWLHFNATTRTFSGTPSSNSDIGDLNIKITATDPSDESISATFILSIAKTLSATNTATAITYTEDTLYDLADIVITTPSNTVTARLTLSDPAAGNLTVGTSGAATSTYNQIAGVWEASDNPADVNALLAQIKYQPALNYNDAFSIAVNIIDGYGQSLSSAINAIGIAVNDALVLSSSGGSFVYVENALATVIDGSIIVRDVDNPNIVSAIVWISSGFASGEDILEFTDQNGITGSYNAATGALTLSGSTSKENYQIALRSIKYKNTSENPSLTGRIISFKVNDGDLDSNIVTREITVQRVNDAPVISIPVGSISYAEDSVPVIIAPTLSISDIDSTNLRNATVKIIDGFAASEDILSFTPQAGIVGSYDAQTGTLTFTGIALIADYQTVLRSVTYRDNSENPSAANRSITFQVTDDSGAASATVTKIISVVPVDDAPVVNLSLQNQTACCVTSIGQAYNFTFAANTFTDVDDSTLTYNATKVDGTVLPSWLHFNATTRTFSGTPLTNSDIGNLNIKVTAADPSGACISDMFTLSIAKTLSATNTVTAIAYIEDMLYDLSDIVITTPSNAVTARLTLSDPAAGNLTVGRNGAITSTYNQITGVWEASGDPANVNVLLSQIKYQPAANYNSAFSIAVNITDGYGQSLNSTINAIGTAINDVPELSSSGGSFVYVENAVATVVDASITVTDVDNENIASATVWISSGFTSGEDGLEFINQNGITGSYNAATGALTLSGSVTKENYQIALRSIKYKNNSKNPSLVGRIISFKVNDGALDSNIVTRGIMVERVNDAPVVTISPNSISYPENSAAIIIASTLNITDVDSVNLKNATVKIIGGFTVGEDILFFTPQAGIVGSYDAQTGTLTFTGIAPIADYQTVLRSITYRDNSENSSVANRSVTFQVTDNEGATSVAVTKTLQVIAVNDAPIVHLPLQDQTSCCVAGVGQAYNFTFAANTFTDVDSDILTYTATRVDGAALPSWLHFNATTRTFSGIPDNNSQIGNLSIKVTANDGHGGTVFDTFTLQIAKTLSAINTNRTISYIEDTPCSFVSPIAITTPSNTITVQLTLSNPTAGSLSIGTSGSVTSTYNVVTGLWQASGSTVDVNALLAALKFNPTLNRYDGFSIAVSISDSYGQTLTDTINAIGALVNDQPILTVNQLTIVEGRSIILTTAELNATDVDNLPSQLTFTIANLEHGKFERVSVSGITITNFTLQEVIDGQIRFVHDGGEIPPSYAVSVNDGLLSTTPVNATVVFTHVNDAPVVNVALQTQISCCVTGIGQAYIFTFASNAFTDVDGDILTYTATKADDSALPSWLTFTSATRTFGGTPSSNSDIGDLNLKVTATDPNGASVSDTFTLNIVKTLSATNIATAIAYTEDTEYNLADIVITTPSGTVAARLTLSDPAVGNLTTGTSGTVISTYNKTTGIWEARGNKDDINALLAQVKYQPTANYNGAFSIAVSITDGYGQSLSSTISAIGTVINDAPVLTVNQLTISEGQSIILTTSHLNAVDADNIPSELMFTINKLQHGKFERIGSKNKTVTTFTLQEIIDGQIKFTHNGSKNPPSYEVSVSDSITSTAYAAATIRFTNVDDRPEKDGTAATAAGAAAGGAAGIGLGIVGFWQFRKMKKAGKKFFSGWSQSRLSFNGKTAISKPGSTWARLHPDKPEVGSSPLSTALTEPTTKKVANPFAQDLPSSRMAHGLGSATPNTASRAHLFSNGVETPEQVASATNKTSNPLSFMK